MNAHANGVFVCRVTTSGWMKWWSGGGAVRPNSRTPYWSRGIPLTASRGRFNASEKTVRWDTTGILLPQPATIAAITSSALNSSQGRKHSGDMARIYSIHITNVIGGVASQCRRCAVNPAEFSSACVPCPPGHYMVNGTGVCKSCPPNTIIRADQSVGVDACIPCGPNTERNEVKRVVSPFIHW